MGRKTTKIERAMTDHSKLFDKTSADFDELMKEVEGHVFAGKKNYKRPLKYLRKSLRRAIYEYFVERSAAGQIFWSDAHKLHALAVQMVEILRHETSRSQIFFSLDRIPEFFSGPRSPGKEGYMDLRYEPLLTELDRFLEGQSPPPPPQKLKNQRPARTDLRALVERLANEWRIATKRVLYAALAQGRTHKSCDAIRLCSRKLRGSAKSLRSTENDGEGRLRGASYPFR